MSARAWLVVSMIVALIACVLTSIWLEQRHSAPGAPDKESSALPQALPALLALSPTELAQCDLARMNLLCAQGLAGEEKIDVERCLATLDEWAKQVNAETDRHRHRFRAHPEQFENSEGYFRLLMMAVVVCEDFGVRYNPARISPASLNADDDHFFADPHDVFLHGLLGERRMGTCSSMPVLYVALGRRLGYPVKLVPTKAHLFVRWDGGGERFNVEATGKGMNRYDDAHYRQWPFPVSEEEMKRDGYLKSLSAAEELAVFLSLRGNCLREAGRRAEAATCYAQASRLAPEARAYQVLLAETQGASATADTLGSGRATVVPWRLEGTPVPAIGAVPDPNPLREIR
jgi:hypothetical protein